MKDATAILQTKWFESLNGELEYNSVNVPFYDTVPPDAPDLYVVFSDISSFEETDKTAFGQEINVTIEIISRFSVGYFGSSNAVDSVANQIFELIRTRTGIDLSPNFNNYILTITTDNKFKETTQTHYVIRRVITFNHIIEQLT
jgi:hypothetical protein